MNKQNINEMIRRYFDGATTLEEERELQRCSAADNLPEQMMGLQPMFAFFAEERAITPPVRRNIRLQLLLAAGVAASIAVLFSVVLPAAKQHNNKLFVYYMDGRRIYDESAAIASAESKLQFIAESMQKAQNTMAAFEKMQNGHHTLQQFDRIAEAYSKITMKN